MPKNTFSVTVDLKAFFANHKSKVKLFINENINNVSDLEDKITEIFGIQKFHLMCNESLLPSCEDIRVLGNGDSVCALPNEDGEEVKLLNKTYYKEKETVNYSKKKKKHVSDADVIEESPIVAKKHADVMEESPIVAKKHQKKKREAPTPPKDVPESVKHESPKKPEKESPPIRREKIKPKDRAVSWSTNPLPKTINHVKIAKIPVVNYSKFSFEPMDSTPDTNQKSDEYHPFSSVTPSHAEMEVSETTNEYLITKKENPTFSSLPLQNNKIEPSPVSLKKETELKNWKHSILEKFTHNLQASEQNIPDVEKNEISSTNRERDELVNDSSSNSIISKVTKLNPESCRIKKKNQWRQASGVGYYLKLMDKIGWDSSKSILGVDPNESAEAKEEIEAENQVENSVNGDSTSDYPSDFLTKRKRKRKHKKRPRASTPGPRMPTPIPMKYLEELSSNGTHSTPSHIRFEEAKEPVSGQGTPVPIEDFNEDKSEENVKILQNLTLHTQLDCKPNKSNESGINEYFETLNTPQVVKKICSVCEGEKPDLI